MATVIGRLIADATLIALLLFIPARTVTWWHAWVLIAAQVVVRLVTAIAVHRVNPTLLRERAKLPIHRDQPSTDRFLLVAVITTGYLALPAITAFDVFRWHLLPRPSPFIASLGLVLFILGWSMKGLALRTNAFATTVVRVQRERQHAVVDRGVYGFIRHPFYAGTPLVLVGLALWLESYTVALLATVPMAFVVMRLQLEERFLRRELPGYSEYTLRVPYRLIPGIW